MARRGGQTIACHLRYGVGTLAPMTEAALRGSLVAFYPEGRARQRPATLVPRPGEPPHQAVRRRRLRPGVRPVLPRLLTEPEAGAARSPVSAPDGETAKLRLANVPLCSRIAWPVGSAP